MDEIGTEEDESKERLLMNGSIEQRQDENDKNKWWKEIYRKTEMRKTTISQIKKNRNKEERQRSKRGEGGWRNQFVGGDAVEMSLYIAR